MIEGSVGRSRRRAVPLIVAALLAATAVPAAAVHEPLTDPSDVDGRFDVRLVTHRHDARPRVWLITMYPKWTIRNAWDAGYALVNLDTVGGPQQDYYVVIRSNGKGLRAVLFRDRDRKRDVAIGTPRVWKNGRTAGVEVPWSKLKVGDARESYRWSVLTLWIGGACPRTCFDLAPNGGAWVEQLYEEPEPPREGAVSGASPEPSPSSEPEPTGPPGPPTDAPDQPPGAPSPDDTGSPPPDEPGSPSPTAAASPQADGSPSALLNGTTPVGT